MLRAHRTHFLTRLIAIALCALAPLSPIGAIYCLGCDVVSIAGAEGHKCHNTADVTEPAQPNTPPTPSTTPTTTKPVAHSCCQSDAAPVSDCVASQMNASDAPEETERDCDGCPLATLERVAEVPPMAIGDIVFRLTANVLWSSVISSIANSIDQFFLSHNTLSDYASHAPPGPVGPGSVILRI